MFLVEELHDLLVLEKLDGVFVAQSSVLLKVDELNQSYSEVLLQILLSQNIEHFLLIVLSEPFDIDSIISNLEHSLSEVIDSLINPMSIAFILHRSRFHFLVFLVLHLITQTLSEVVLLVINELMDLFVVCSESTLIEFI